MWKPKCWLLHSLASASGSFQKNPGYSAEDMQYLDSMPETGLWAGTLNLVTKKH